MMSFPGCLLGYINKYHKLSIGGKFSSGARRTGNLLEWWPSSTDFASSAPTSPLSANFADVACAAYRTVNLCSLAFPSELAQISSASCPALAGRSVAAQSVGGWLARELRIYLAWQGYALLFHPTIQPSAASRGSSSVLRPARVACDAICAPPASGVPGASNRECKKCAAARYAPAQSFSCV